MFYILILIISCVVHAIKYVVPALARTRARARVGLKYNMCTYLYHMLNHMCLTLIDMYHMRYTFHYNTA